MSIPNTNRSVTHWLALLIGGVALMLPACETEGHFTFLGYSTQPNYDPDIKTVYVPIFENRTFRKNIEFELTQAVIRAIEEKTPFKVVHNCDVADTELLGVITTFNKAILNRNQQNEVREAETVLMVQVIWRDRRSGEILSGPGRNRGEVPPLPGMPALDLTQPLPLAEAPGLPGARPGEVVPGEVVPGIIVPKPAPPALVSSYATFIPELGESIATSEKANFDRLAVRIVSLMEQAW